MIYEFACQVCGAQCRKHRANHQTPPRWCSKRCAGMARIGTTRGGATQAFVCAGCGTATVRKSNYKPGDARYCSKSCQDSNVSGERNPNYRGGRRRMKGGYVGLHMPWREDADKTGCVPEHRFVMEQAIGRRLLPAEVVHHKNHVRDDNRPENLELLASQAEHMSLHRREGMSK